MIEVNHSKGSSKRTIGPVTDGQTQDVSEGFRSDIDYRDAHASKKNISLSLNWRKVMKLLLLLLLLLLL